MVKLIYLIYSTWISEVLKALTDHVNVAFCLAIGLVVIRGGYLKLDLMVLHRLLEVRGKSTVYQR
jgi:hypothetical protein